MAIMLFGPYMLTVLRNFLMYAFDMIPQITSF
jgi:flagellar biosynthesis protein FliQ